MNELVEEIAINIKETKFGKSTKWIECSDAFKDVTRKQAKSAIQTILNNFKSKDYGDFENAIDELEKALNDE